MAVKGYNLTKIPLEKVLNQNHGILSSDRKRESELEKPIQGSLSLCLSLAKDDSERKLICSIEARRSRIIILKEKMTELVSREHELQDRVDNLNSINQNLELEIMRLTICNIELELKIFQLKQRNHALMQYIA